MTNTSMLSIYLVTASVLLTVMKYRQMVKCLPHFLITLSVLRGCFFFLLVQSVSLVPEPLLCNSQHFLLSKSAQTFATLCCPHVRSDFKDRLSFLLAALLLHSRVLSTFLGVTPLGPVTHCSLMRQLIRAPLALAILHHHYLE